MLDGTVPEPMVWGISDFMERLAGARSQHDRTRIAAHGLQRLFHARVAVCRGGVFPPQLRDFVDSAVVTPASLHVAAAPTSAEPPTRPASVRSVLICGLTRHQTPYYLVWRDDPFGADELQTADGIAFMLVALYLTWRGKDDHVGNGAVGHLDETPSAFRLTKRETYILEHLAYGLSADAIARMAGISPRTVRKHLQHIYAKVGAHDRLMAVEAARAAGLLCGGHGEVVSP